MDSSKFANSPAKILLFGEYSVLLGSEALAIPLDGFSSTWIPGPNYDKQYDLNQFADYLQTLQLSFQFDHEAFREELNAGWYLASDIPHGYGLGSSGAVVATILKRFAKKIKLTNLLAFQKELALIESFFHGTSSGLDPLVCFLEKPVWIRNKNEVQIPNEPSKEILKKFSLLDSKKPRKTAPLVGIFKEKLNDKIFKRIVEEELVNAQNSGIKAFLNEDIAALEESISSISSIQRKYFSDMILPEFLDWWDEGLQSGDFYIKLCGAGGGGFYLVFTPGEIHPTKLPVIQLV